MSAKRSGLGKGSTSLRTPQPTTGPSHPLAESVGRDQDALKIPLSLIDPDPEQPRKTFDAEALMELALSIKEHGVLQAVLVKQVGERYQLISGERRYRAAKLIELEDLPARVARTTTEVTLLALLENLQREDLTPLDEARALDRLKTELGLKQIEIADQINKSAAFVSERLAILNYPPDVIELLEKKPGVLREAREIARDQNPSRRKKKIAALLGEAQSAEPAPRTPVEAVVYKKGKRGFDLKIQYRKGKTDIQQVIEQLEKVLEDLRNTSSTSQTKR